MTYFQQRNEIQILVAKLEPSFDHRRHQYLHVQRLTQCRSDSIRESADGVV